MLVILPLVTGAIAMVLITTLKNQQGIEGKVTRLQRSHHGIGLLRPRHRERRQRDHDVQPVQFPRALHCSASV